VSDVNDRDPRLTPARSDLAAKYLEGKVAASRFVEGALREVIAPQAPVRRKPAHDAPLDTEALKGERVTVYETTDEGWCWGQLGSDGYVGWLPASMLAAPGAPVTDKVAVLRTLAFPGPSIKLPPVEALSLGCTLHIAKREGEFAVTAAGHYLPARHLAPLAAMEKDFVAVAERFVGVPYLWGGKTSLGLDCSGLVQVALTACGIGCPRDSDMQEGALGAAQPLDAKFRRGDLLFWAGHVAIARDERTMVHANGFHMATAVEPIEEGAARIEKAGSKLRSVKRL
jgi:cell wall-associated NlpC family hydrolase